MKYWKFLFIPILYWFIITTFQSCSNDNFEEYYTSSCDTLNVTYSVTIAPVIDRNCLGCHFAGNSTGVDLETYSDVKDAADNDALLGALKHLEGYTPMPLNGKLDDCTIQKIEIWIKNGTLNN
jgi:hypothetical protein